MRLPRLKRSGILRSSWTWWQKTMTITSSRCTTASDGAPIAKSNTTLLRSREPVYRSLRELVMSYFDSYFNTHGVRSLRSYSAPVDLRRFDAISWRTTESPLDPVEDWLYHIRHYPLVTR